MTSLSVHASSCRMTQFGVVAYGTAAGYHDHRVPDDFSDTSCDGVIRLLTITTLWGMIEKVFLVLFICSSGYFLRYIVCTFSLCCCVISNLHVSRLLLK